MELKIGEHRGAGCEQGVVMGLVEMHYMHYMKFLIKKQKDPIWSIGMMSGGSFDQLDKMG